MYAECDLCNSYNTGTRGLAHLLHVGAKRPRAINELSARASMLYFITGLLQFCSEVVSFVVDISNEPDERYYQY